MLSSVLFPDLKSQEVCFNLMNKELDGIRFTAGTFDLKLKWQNIRLLT